jgi:hypothetical protein
MKASYQVLLHLAEGFQRRRLKCEKLTDDGCQVMTNVQVHTNKNTVGFTEKSNDYYYAMGSTPPKATLQMYL